MSRPPPVELPERPGQLVAGPLGIFLLLAWILAGVACGNSTPSGSGLQSRSEAPTSMPSGSSVASPSVAPTPNGSGDAQPGDVDGLVVLTGGALSIGTPAGLLVGIEGPGGQVSGFSAANGRLIVQTTGPAFAIADVGRAASAPLAWRTVDMATIEVRHWLATPALSPRGDRVALAGAEPGTNEPFQVLAVDLVSGDLRSVSMDRESNGPLVWIDETNLLMEVLPIPGGTRFLRLDLATRRVDPVRADGFGPAISGDGSLLAVASTDGSVVAVPAADWLAGGPPDEGSVVDASGNPFQLAVDSLGGRIAIGYADAGGDPASVAIFVREGGGWRRSGASVKVAPGTLTMLGWLY